MAAALVAAVLTAITDPIRWVRAHRLAQAAVAVTGGAVLGGATTGSWQWATVAAGGVLGAGAWQALVLYGWLRVHTDRFTALAGTAVVCGLAAAVVVIVPATCPTTTSEFRCGTSDVAVMGLVGALLPVMCATFVYPVTVTVRTARRIWRRARRCRPH